MGEQLSAADRSPEGQLFGRLSGHLAQHELYFGSYTGSPQDRLQFGDKLLDFFFTEEERGGTDTQLYDAARHYLERIGKLVARNHKADLEDLEARCKELSVEAADQQLHKRHPPVAMGQKVLTTVHAGDWQEPVKDALAAVILAAQGQNEVPQQGDST